MRYEGLQAWNSKKCEKRWWASTSVGEPAAQPKTNVGRGTGSYCPINCTENSDLVDYEAANFETLIPLFTLQQNL